MRPTAPKKVAIESECVLMTCEVDWGFIRDSIEFPWLPVQLCKIERTDGLFCDVCGGWAEVIYASQECDERGMQWSWSTSLQR